MDPRGAFTAGLCLFPGVWKEGPCPRACCGEGRDQPEGSALSLSNAVRSALAHGQLRGRRSLTPRAWRATLPATWKSRYLRRLGSQAESAVPESRSIRVQASRSQPMSTSSSHASFMAKERKGRLRSPLALAQRIESSTAAWERCTCSRRAMRLPFWLVRKTWKRWPSSSVKESWAP